MNKLCCLVSPTWACNYCTWKLCRTCWKGAAIEHHEYSSSKCPIVLNNTPSTTQLGQNVLYKLISREEDEE